MGVQVIHNEFKLVNKDRLASVVGLKGATHIKRLSRGLLSSYTLESTLHVQI